MFYDLNVPAGAEAEKQFNAGAKLFFTETLRAAKAARPNGKFGFYEYPMGASKELLWLWQEVGVLCGSDYGRSAATTAASVNQSLLAAAMVQSAATKAGVRPLPPRPDVLTFVWLWPGAKPVSEAQVRTLCRSSLKSVDCIYLY